MNPQDAIVEKIKKLLELASSPNEAEAQLAMKRAQELIAKYSVNLADSTSPDEIIEQIYKPPIHSAGYKEQLPQIVNGIGKLFSCHTLINGVTGEPRLIGFKTNITVAVHALDCIFYQLQQDFRREYQKHRSISFSNAFWVGAVEGLHRKFIEHEKVGTGLILYDKTAAWMKEKYPNLCYRQAGGDSSFEVGKSAGINTGLSASIRSGVGASSGGKLLG